MVISVETTQDKKTENVPWSSTTVTGTQQGPVVWNEHPLVHPSNESLNKSSRASSVQCDEIISNEGIANNSRNKTGKTIDEQSYGYLHDRPVNRFRVCGESDKPRKPNITDQNADLYTLIKTVVREQIQGAKPAQWKRFDGVIVYDKRDYDQAIICKRRMEDIMSQSDVKEPVRIELYDNEQFLQSSVRVVDDVISKSSVIFVLLSVHSNTRQMDFFCEEAVARLHIDPSNQSTFGAASAFDTPLKCIIKPLQTAPSSHRMYRIPPGLMSMTSIDIFDFASSFTRDKIISTLREAINTRIRQAERDNTKREFAYMHILTTGSQAPPQFSSHPMYNPALNGDMHSNGGVRKSTNGTTVFVKPSSGHHQQTGYQERRSHGGVANGSATFTRPLSTNHNHHIHHHPHHHHSLNDDTYSNFGLVNESNAFIRPPSDHQDLQHHQKFYAQQTPYIQMRVPPVSPESEPNPMDKLPPYFATNQEPKEVVLPRNVHTTEQWRQAPLQQTYTHCQQHEQVIQSHGHWHEHAPVTSIHMTGPQPRKADDTHSRQLKPVQHNDKPEQIPNGNRHITDHCFSTDGLRSTFSSASVLGNQPFSLINRRQYIPPFNELIGSTTSYDAYSSNDLNSDDLEID